MTKNSPKPAKMVIAAAILLSLLVYVFFQSKDFISGPQISITYPTEGIYLDDTFVSVKGTAHRVAYLSLNDRPIFVNESGVFEEALLAHEGYTILSLKATDRFGREREIKRSFVAAKERPPNTASLSGPEREH